jgi:hypothetical protein
MALERRSFGNKQMCKRGSVFGRTIHRSFFQFSKPATEKIQTINPTSTKETTTSKRKGVASTLLHL